MNTSSLPSGTETVLLAEDDDGLRKLTALMLKRYGYTVLEAANGAQALSIAARQPGGSIQMLLTDIDMPGANGITVAASLRDQQPSLSVILMSGSAINMPPNLSQLVPNATFLQKPFTMATLLQAIRALLDV